MNRQLELQLACDKAHEHLAAALYQINMVEALADERNVLPGIAKSLTEQAIVCVQTVKPVPTTLAQE